MGVVCTCSPRMPSLLVSWSSIKVLPPSGYLWISWGPKSAQNPAWVCSVSMSSGKSRQAP
eukprot:853857-Amphidinium_carterae.1